MCIDDDEELFFVVWLTDEKRLAFFLAEVIVKALYHHNLRHTSNRFEPAQNLRSDLVEWSCTVVATFWSFYYMEYPWPFLGG